MACVVLLLIFSCVGFVICKSVSPSSWEHDYDDLHLNKTFTCDGPSRSIAENQLYRLEISEELPPTHCLLTFEAEAIGSCSGVCYMFVPNANIKKDVAQLEIRTGGYTETYSLSNPVRGGPQCTTETTMVLTFALFQNYTYNLKSRSFHLTLEIYNKCGEKGMVKNIKYEEAIKHLTGYHHENEFAKNQRTIFIEGTLTGFGMASVFLLIFVAACCYVRNHEPGRRPNKTVGKGPSSKPMLKGANGSQRK